MNALVMRMGALRDSATGNEAIKIIAYGDVLSEAGIATFLHLLLLVEIFPE